MGLIIHNVENKPKRINVDGKRIFVKWNSENNTISIPVTWDTSEEKEIKIKFKK